MSAPAIPSRITTGVKRTRFSGRYYGNDEDDGTNGAKVHESGDRRFPNWATMAASRLALFPAIGKAGRTPKLIPSIPCIISQWGQSCGLKRKSRRTEIQSPETVQASWRIRYQNQFKAAAPLQRARWTKLVEAVQH